MLVARARSRLVKLILPIASTIGRASKLVMSICSTVVDSNSALRTSLAGASGCETVISHSPPSRKREGSRSEEHTSELQSLMRISYAVFCLKKKNTQSENPHTESLTLHPTAY